jgi:hypothetical protein
MQTWKKALKRAGTIFIGTAMFGATLSGALAQLDLADYPAPFVVDGQYDTSTAFLVGNKAAASDTLATVDIATNLQFESKTCVRKAGAGGDITVSGDAIAVSDPSDLLELGEEIGNVREVLTEVELDGLRGGTITTNAGSTEYNQYLRFQDTSNTIVSPIVNFTENDDVNEQVGDFLYVKEGTNVTSAFFEYELEFEEGLESDIESGKLDDLEDEELVLLGNVYNIVNTKIDTAADDVTIEMLGGAIFDTLEEGEEKTYTIDGKDYQVEILIIEDVQPETVTLVINGEVTDQLDEGETEILDDGLMIGISDIVANEAGEAGSGDIVEFYLGATKLELKDTDYTDDTFVQLVKIDEESIEDAYVKIKGVELSSTEFEISSIKYRLVADAIPGQKDIFVPKGHGIREFLDEPEGMLGNWDILYEGLDDTGVSILKFDPSGDDEYDLEFENRAGQIYVFPFVTNEAGTFKYGDDDDDFVFLEGALVLDDNVTNDYYNIGQKDYFLLSNMDAAQDDTSFSHVVRYASIDTSNKILTFDDLAVGTRQFTYAEQNSTNAGAGEVLGKSSLVFGGNSYTTYVKNDSGAAAHYPLAIDQNGNGTFSNFERNSTVPTDMGFFNGGQEEVRITVNGGGILDLGLHTSNTTGMFGPGDGNGYNSTGNSSTGFTIAAAGEVNVTLRTLSSEFDEDGPTPFGATDEQLGIGFHTRAGNEMGINTTNYKGMTSLTEPDDNEDHKFGMSYYGVFLDLFDQSGNTDAETLTIEYPLRQRGAQVFIALGETSTSRTKSGEVCTVADIKPRTLLDTEVTNPSDYNLILVGGPCANDVVADVAGFPTCEGYREMYKSGESIIQMANNGANVALLVAGYDAVDTRKAGKVLANSADYSLSGSKVVVRGTLGSPSVSAQ